MTDTDTTITEPYPGFAAFVELARHVKEQAVARYDGTEDATDDIAPALHLVASEPIALELVCVAPQINRDQALAALHLLVGAVNADVATMVADAHTSNEEINPATGERWKQGEMQQACDVEGACSVGTLDDCLAFTTAWPDGRNRMDTRIYTVTKGAAAGESTITWSGHRESSVLDTADAEGQASAQGVIPEAFARAFANSRLWHVVYATEIEDEALEVYRRSLRIIVTLFVEQGYTLMVSTQDDALRKMMGGQ